MKPDEQKLIPFPLDHDDNIGALPEVSRDADLNAVLRHWTSPVASADLDARVLESYRDSNDTLPRRRRLRGWIARALIVVAVLAGGFAAVWTIADRQPVAAMELLEESRRADAMSLAGAAMAVHRVCAYEERRASDGAILERRRVESWHRGATPVQARRVFDNAGQIVAGEWIDSSGSRQTYVKTAVRGAAPLTSWRPPIGAAVFLNDQSWWIEPSAESFLALLPAGAVDELTTSELGSDRIVVAYRSDERDAVLEAAQIVLRRSNYHAIEQSLRVRQNGNVREFHVRELSLELIAAGAVSDSVFEPDIPDTSPGTPIDVREVREPAARMTDTELLGLELSLLDRLDRVEALVGQEASVSRRTDGRLEVTALVEGDERKKTLLEAVEGLSRSPAVNVDIRTFAEAAQTANTIRSSNPATVRDIVVSGQIAARDALMRFFSTATGSTINSPTSIDEAVRRFANEALRRSRDAVLHAGTARDLLTRFSAAQISSMDPGARDQWRTLVVGHLRQVERESGMLRRSLEPVFFVSTASDSELEDRPPAAVDVAADRLFSFAVRHDEAIRAAFALSARPTGDLEVSRIDFLQSLRAAENLAREIANQL